MKNIPVIRQMLFIADRSYFSKTFLFIPSDPVPIRKQIMKLTKLFWIPTAEFSTKGTETRPFKRSRHNPEYFTPVKPVKCVNHVNKQDRTGKEKIWI